ncbi:hypothetical protein [Desulfofustis limnaeus]|jgi:hypothetical protein|uniref:Uncharacterized protein n=1 Tax=Desulfofustis limnaeus TaxID=2740163 RepID=A0ABM7WAU5_9BACT|nr:hypothetical protein [Desulfofustis limnaeus]MDX9895404.1 hypothetical protein [Desulfofustis sp.]BDD88103.1 hypothetical protein DPPLL_24680 [Desulfofustis limnaeus]
MVSAKPSLLLICLAMIGWLLLKPTAGPAKTAIIKPTTPSPIRFVVQGTTLIDQDQPGTDLFLRGIGYSPFLPGETPIYGAAPGNDGRYAEHLEMITGLGATYLHVFPRLMPPEFFIALDHSNLIYGQDVWIWPYQEDLLDPAYQAKTLTDIKEVIDHTYRVGRPDRLLLFSIGDELQAAAVAATNARHPNVKDYHGAHLVVTGRTASEVAMAKLVDAAMTYELSRYGQRHLYCHTSWTHIGPIADRPDLEVSEADILVPDMGDLICLNIYTYARGVRTSPPGSVTGSAYQGYLEQLAAETTRPILVTQVGLSTSPIAPKPWVPGFGGHDIDDVARTYRSIWQDIRTARGREKIYGLAFFEFIDEWWKSGETPTDTEAHQPEDPEEWFGIYRVARDGTLTAKGAIPATVRELFTAP